MILTTFIGQYIFKFIHAYILVSLFETFEPYGRNMRVGNLSFLNIFWLKII